MGNETLVEREEISEIMLDKKGKISYHGKRGFLENSVVLRIIEAQFGMMS